jgi:hypothetical protein
LRNWARLGVEFIEERLRLLNGSLRHHRRNLRLVRGLLRGLLLLRRSGKLALCLVALQPRQIVFGLGELAGNDRLLHVTSIGRLR